MRMISQMLLDARIEKGFTLEEIVKSTKIKKEFLVAIEAGRYHDLPSESYALGFIKNYASFLNIDQAKATALFRREYEGRQGKFLPTFKSQDKRLRRKLLFTPRNFIIGAIFLAIVGYVIFQYSSYLFGPKLEVIEPQEKAIIKNNIVEVSGKTDPYATVLINNEETYVRLDGTFKKTLYLFEGERQIVVDSRNRNGKDTKKIINVSVR